MPFNLTKTYPDLLEIRPLDEYVRNRSLRGIFDRDIACNPNFNFRGKWIFPTKKADGDAALDTLFSHLTCKAVYMPGSNGSHHKHREHDPDRSERLHWIKNHVDEIVAKPGVEVFSYRKRIDAKHSDCVRTYIYNAPRRYVIVLEPQPRNNGSYYLITAYYLSDPFGQKTIENMMKHKLDEIA